MMVLVTGGRDYNNSHVVNAALDALLDVIEVLATGACPYGGADLLAENWAKAREVNYRGYPAPFKTIGRSAGPRRNLSMLADFKPDLVVAFPGGRGTTHCVAAAQQLGIEVRTIVPHQNPPGKL